VSCVPVGGQKVDVLGTLVRLARRPSPVLSTAKALHGHRNPRTQLTTIGALLVSFTFTPFLPVRRASLPAVSQQATGDCSSCAGGGPTGHPFKNPTQTGGGPGDLQLTRAVALDPAWLAWQGGDIPRLARAIYDDRALDRLPILADAREEAGCTDAALLGNLRGPGAPPARLLGAGCRAGQDVSGAVAGRAGATGPAGRLACA
jgi:hypothetical protein